MSKTRRKVFMNTCHLSFDAAQPDNKGYVSNNVFQGRKLVSVPSFDENVQSVAVRRRKKDEYINSVSNVLSLRNFVFKTDYNHSKLVKV